MKTESRFWCIFKFYNCTDIISSKSAADLFVSVYLTFLTLSFEFVITTMTVGSLPLSLTCLISMNAIF